VPRPPKTYRRRRVKEGEKGVKKENCQSWDKKVRQAEEKNMAKIGVSQFPLDQWDCARASYEVEMLIKDYPTLSTVGLRQWPKEYSSLGLGKGRKYNVGTCVSGTLPVVHGSKARIYNLPLDIWIPVDFPSLPPLIVVPLPPNVVLMKNHSHVAENGVVFTTYIYEWNASISTLRGAVHSVKQVLDGNIPIRLLLPSSTETTGVIPSTSSSPAGGSSSSSTEAENSTAAAAKKTQEDFRVAIEYLAERLRAVLVDMDQISYTLEWMDVYVTGIDVLQDLRSKPDTTVEYYYAKATALDLALTRIVDDKLPSVAEHTYLIKVRDSIRKLVKRFIAK
jgi:hypothetical protein